MSQVINKSLGMVLETLNSLSLSAPMNELNEIDSSFSTLNENNFTDLILYGSDKPDDKKNHKILMSTIKLIKDSQRFDQNML